MKKKPNVDHDIAFNEKGEPYMLGAEVRMNQARIIEHPDAKPVLVVAELNGELGIRAYGPPSEEMAALLDFSARTYRRSLPATNDQTQ